MRLERFNWPPDRFFSRLLQLPVELLPHLDVGSFDQSLVAVFDLPLDVVLVLLHRRFFDLREAIGLFWRYPVQLHLHVEDLPNLRFDSFDLVLGDVFEYKRLTLFEVLILVQLLQV